MRNDREEILIFFLAVFTIVCLLVLYLVPVYSTNRSIERAKNEIIEEMQQQEVIVKVVYEYPTPPEPGDEEISIELRDEGVKDE